jgi:hypothetical protein
LRGGRNLDVLDLVLKYLTIAAAIEVRSGFGELGSEVGI